MTTLGSIDGGRQGARRASPVSPLHSKIAFTLVFLLVVFIVVIVGGGLIYTLFSNRTIELPETTTSTTSTSSTTTTSTVTTSTTQSSTTTTTSTTQSSTTSTTESTTTTLSIYQVAFCIGRKVDILYMRNDSVCFKCKSIRNYFGDTMATINVVDCEDNTDQCRLELEDYRDNRLTRTPGGSVTEAIGYPAAVINDIAYVGVTSSALQELTGCGQ